MVRVRTYVAILFRLDTGSKKMTSFDISSCSRGSLLFSDVGVSSAVRLLSPLFFCQDDRELITKLRPLARFSTAEDHEELINNLILAKQMR